jgi:predicted AAA+ superfamily ATPase
MNRGGFPAVQSLHENERRTVLQDYVNTVIFRDIVERYKITNTSLIKYLIKTLINNVSSFFAVHKFYKDIKSQGFKVSKDTIYQYMEYIEDAFLIFNVPIFTESIRKMQINPKKIYVVDNGLVCANLFGASLKLGNLFENQVYLDLRKKGKEIWYYKTFENYEVDFVVKNLDGSFELLQVVWDISDDEILKREKRALERAKEELGMDGRIVTPQDYLFEYLSKKRFF